MPALRIMPALILAVVASSAYAGDEQVVTTSHAPSSLPALVSSDATNAPSGSASSSSASDQTQTLYAKPQGYESNGRTIHGGGGVSVGTGGYRSGYVYTLIPVGEDGTLGLAYSQTDFGKGNGYYWGNGYRSRGGTATSASIMLDMSGSHSRQDDKGCASGFSDGHRMLEPVWVTKLNGDRDCYAEKNAHPDDDSE